MGKMVILATRSGLGSVAEGDRPFGVEMFDSFLHALESEIDSVEALCFYTEGVRLVAGDSKVVPSLKLVQGLGARIVSCRTCLSHYGLLESVAVGEVGTMKEIVQLIARADRVVSV